MWVIFKGVDVCLDGRKWMLGCDIFVDGHWKEACLCGMACCLSFLVIMLSLCGILIDLWVWGFYVQVGVKYC